MKIAIIIERYDISLGGAEWLVYELTSALSKLGVDVDILAAQGKRSADNIRILGPESQNKRHSLSSFAKLISNYIDKNHYDIIHSLIPLSFADVYQPPGGSFAETIIRNAASYRNTFISSYKKATAFTNWRRTELVLAEKKLCRDIDGPIIAALSNYVIEQFKNHYNLSSERFVLVPNGVKIDSEIETEIAEKLKKQIFQQLGIDSSTDPVFFLFGANNFRLKGLGVLIEALALLEKSQTHRMPYLIVAGGGKINKFRSIAEKSGVNKKIAFLGHLPHIQNALSISNVAVLPTFFDPCSRYILEALAACKPVITTKFNGASDFFVNNRHGKVLDAPENVNALAEAIRYFTDTKNIASATKAIIEDKLKENISIDRAARQLIEVYETIRGEKPAMMHLFFPLAIISAYLLGSIPFGLLIAKAHGKDLRSIGSGNIGATNVSRALGRRWAYFCFVLDVLKGFVPMFITMLVTRPENVLTFWLWLAVGCAAIAGHIFPIYLKFKGGKGVATSFGVALGLWPYYTICVLIAFGVWIVVVLIWRYVSLASIIASITFILALIAAIIAKPKWEFANLWPIFITAVAIPVMVIVRHRENIKRLLAGTESKIRQKKDS